MLNIDRNSLTVYITEKLFNHILSDFWSKTHNNFVHVIKKVCSIII